MKIIKTLDGLKKFPELQRFHEEQEKWLKSAVEQYPERFAGIKDWRRSEAALLTHHRCHFYVLENEDEVRTFQERNGDIIIDEFLRDWKNSDKPITCSFRLKSEDHGLGYFIIPPSARDPNREWDIPSKARV